MNSLSSHYKNVFGKELVPLGFHLYKKTFYRVINDVVQTIMLRKTETNFTLDFDVIPLCLPVDDLYCEGFDLANIGKRWWWDCYGEIGEDIFAEPLAFFRQYAFPVFERSIDSSTAYDELVNFKNTYYASIVNDEVRVASYYLFLMSVKVNDYEKAHRHLSAIMRKWDEAYQYKLAEREKEVTPAMNLAFERFMVQYRQRQEMMEMVSARNATYFRQLIATNENISLEYLRNPRKRSRPY